MLTKPFAIMNKFRLISTNHGVVEIKNMRIIYTISVFELHFWASGFLHKVKAQPGPAHVFIFKAHPAHGLGRG